MVIQIALKGGVAVFTWLSIEATNKYIEYTTLGSFISHSMSDISKAIILGGIALILLTVFDRFSAMATERKREIDILKTIGWKNVHIGKLIYGEALILLSLIGTAIVFLIAIGGFRFIYSELPVSYGNISAAFTGIITAVLVICIAPFYKAVLPPPIEAVTDRASVREGKIENTRK
ncbi:FtsX-like permease family protein [Clostridium polynesiense]|uniref:FtsX-like permease family protein n=1 Tax=Clostridium polynesiense TaxID=1325933 RepID=UPI00058DCB8B|nr:FtsX-like permease family protein [Clostridium polynesiense]